MLESISQAFQYKKLSQDEMSKRGILGRLIGPIADGKNPTRNGRKYNTELWEKVFEDPIMQEKITNRCLFGEIGHPEDRTETDPEKIAICLAEQPKKARDGKLWGVFDILDTPNGRILKAMCDYGCKIGVSSRGEGDVVEDLDGNEAVDPETYSCQAWDAVLLPAVKEARMDYVVESLNKTRYNKTLKQKLTEELEKASDDDKRIMEETLDDLGIELEKEVNDKIKENEEQVEEKEELVEEEKLSSEDKIEKQYKNFEVKQIDIEKLGNSEGYHGFIEIAFPEVNQDNFNETAVSELNVYDNNLERIALDTWFPKEAYDKLCDVIKEEIINKFIQKEELEVEEECNNESCSDKEEVQEKVIEDNETNLIKELQETIQAKNDLEAGKLKLQNQLAVGNAEVKKLEEKLTKYKDLAVKLSDKAKRFKTMSEEVSKLQVTISEQDKELVRLRENISAEKVNRQKLDESMNSEKAKNKKLIEELVNDKADAELKQAEAEKKLTRANKLTEAYKKAANETMRNYIESKAAMLGVSVKNIKDRLPNSYDVNDVNRICEDLQAYNLNISKLPFGVAKMKFKESKKDNLRIENLADEIDDELLAMAKLK